MANYQVGDVMVFSHTKDSEWLLAEINNKFYLFINIWGGERWNSHKIAPIHRMGPDRLYRDGKLLHERAYAVPS